MTIEETTYAEILAKKAKECENEILGIHIY